MLLEEILPNAFKKPKKKKSIRNAKGVSGAPSRAPGGGGWYGGIPGNQSGCGGGGDAGSGGGDGGGGGGE